MVSRLRRTLKAVMHQRFSFVPVVVLFILSVPSGAAILEQLPDALRRWISDGGVGARQAVLSMLSTLGLGAFLIIAGRYRTGYAFRHPKVDPPPEPQRDADPPYLWVWLVGPVVAVAGAVVALATLARRGHPVAAALRVPAAAGRGDHRVPAAAPSLGQASERVPLRQRRPASTSAS